MNSHTLHALNRINSSFYESLAQPFSATRGSPWKGWGRVLEEWSAGRDPSRSGPPSVLDVGCGNGRFGRFLALNWKEPFSYWGLDRSPALLETARRSIGGRGRRRFLAVDFVEHEITPYLRPQTFSLIGLFGVLHHVPGFRNRRSLLEQLVPSLEPGGLLALTLWQFGASERFLSRIVAWEEYNRGRDCPVDLRQLEPGDVLLRWGDTSPDTGRDGARPPMPPIVRYCHFTDPEEARRLVAGLPVGDSADAPTSFLSDGKTGDLNLYLLLRGA